MFDNDGNESPILSQTSVTDAQEYFDGEGKLLRKHYPFVYDELFKEAKRQNLDISFVDPDAPLEVRCAAIKANQREIGASYLRCSTKMQDSYPGQAVQSIAKGLRNNIIILPDFVAGDKAKTGKKINRPGLNTLKAWIRAKHISAITFFSANRCARTFYKGLQFIKEEVDEYNVRAITIAEDIDTSKPNWGMLMAMNLVLAEMQAKALPAYVRMGHKSHFESGFRIGATQVGYRPVDVLEAGSTKKGKPKATLEVVPEVGDLINKHYKSRA